MDKLGFVIGAGLLLLCLADETDDFVGSVAPQPHIVFVMADDFGWANFGIHAKGQPNENEVQTPRLDALAASGILLDRHYVFRFCSPSRSAFISGRNPIHVNLFNGAIGQVSRATRCNTSGATNSRSLLRILFCPVAGKS